MTKEKLVALRRLHEAATPEHQIFAVGPDGDELATDLVIGDCVYGPMLCTFDTPDIWADQGDWSREKMDAYARVLAAARNALPELLDRLEAAEADNARLRSSLEHVIGVIPNGAGAESSHIRKIYEIAREALGR